MCTWSRKHLDIMGSLIKGQESPTSSIGLESRIETPEKKTVDRKLEFPHHLHV